MEEQILLLFDQATDLSSQQTVLSALDEYSRNEQFLFCLIKILSNKNISLKNRYYSIVLLRHNLQSFFSNLDIILNITKLINSLNLYNIIFFDLPNCLVAQFAAFIAAFQSYALNFNETDIFLIPLEYLNTETLSINDIEIDNNEAATQIYYRRICTIRTAYTYMLISILENKTISTNALIIASELLSQNDSFVGIDFSQFLIRNYSIYFFDNILAKQLLQIIRLVKDYSVVPFLMIEYIDIPENSISSIIELINDFFSVPENYNSNKNMFENHCLGFIASCISKIANVHENTEIKDNSILVENASNFDGEIGIDALNFLAQFKDQIPLSANFFELFNIIFNKVDYDINCNFYGVSRVALKFIKTFVSKYQNELLLSFLLPKIADILKKGENGHEIQCSLRVLWKVWKFVPDIDYLYLIGLHYIEFPRFSVDAAKLLEVSTREVNDIEKVKSAFNKILFIFEQRHDGVYGFHQLTNSISRTLTKIIRKQKGIPLEPVLIELLQALSISNEVEETCDKAYVIAVFIENASFVGFEGDQNIVKLIELTYEATANEILVPSSLHILGAIMSRCPPLSLTIIMNMIPRLYEFFDRNDDTTTGMLIYQWTIDFSAKMVEIAMYMKSLHNLTQEIIAILTKLPFYINPIQNERLKHTSWYFINRLTITVIYSQQELHLPLSDLFTVLLELIKKVLLNTEIESVNVLNTISATLTRIFMYVCTLEAKISFLEHDELVHVGKVLLRSLKGSDNYQNIVTCFIVIYKMVNGMIYVDENSMQIIINNYLSFQEEETKKLLLPGVQLLFANASQHLS